jgi:N-acetylmuramic acid 6-phosphate (MurNAc-6-P) etherase
MEVGFTEQSSTLTANLDLCTPLEMVALFRASDEQLLLEHVQPDYPGLAHASIYARAMEAHTLISEVLRDPHAIVVMSGSGTSGRVAAYCARSFGPQWHYCISGGDVALTKPVENAEDDAQAGAVDLQRVCEGASRVVLIGISCGLSAPYVAGQLEYALQNSIWKFAKPILIGFNPVERARDAPIAGWPAGKTFRSVAQRMEQQRSGIIINPVIGAEPITGSTRMKGGTVTKVLLDVLRYGHVDYVQRLGSAIAHAYSNPVALSLLVERCAKALLASHSVHYWCSDNRYGWLGQIDASECPPTFGASPTDVVGHLQGGGDPSGAVDGDVWIGLCCGDAGSSLWCPEGDNVLSLKLQLNVVSSGAHVMRGKIVGNRMVDLRLANNKLFYRAIGIVQTLGGCDAHTARALLLRSIYPEGSAVVDADDANTIATHVAHATQRERVIPVAVLLGKGLTHAEAIAVLSKQPILRNAIANCNSKQ